MTDSAADGPWFEIQIRRHDRHPDRAEGPAVEPIQLVAATVQPSMAGRLLRAAADEIAPVKPVMRGPQVSLSGPSKPATQVVPAPVEAPMAMRERRR